MAGRNGLLPCFTHKAARNSLKTGLPRDNKTTVHNTGGNTNTAVDNSIDKTDTLDNTLEDNSNTAVCRAEDDTVDSTIHPSLVNNSNTSSYSAIVTGNTASSTPEASNTAVYIAEDNDNATAHHSEVNSNIADNSTSIKLGIVNSSMTVEFKTKNNYKSNKHETDYGHNSPHPKTAEYASTTDGETNTISSDHKTEPNNTADPVSSDEEDQKGEHDRKCNNRKKLQQTEYNDGQADHNSDESCSITEHSKEVRHRHPNAISRTICETPCDPTIRTAAGSVHADSEPAPPPVGRAILRRFSSCCCLPPVRAILRRLYSCWVYRCLVGIISCSVFGVGMWGTLSMQQKFDPTLLLPSTSYLRQFTKVFDTYYPDNGLSALVYTGPLDHSSLGGLERLTNDLEAMANSGKYLRLVESWWPPLKQFIQEKAVEEEEESTANNSSSWLAANHSTWERFANPRDFPRLLSDFLHSAGGSKYKQNFRWAAGRDLECRQPAPPIQAAKFKVQYRTYSGPGEHIPAKAAVEAAINGSGVSSVAFSFTNYYSSWETDEIIDYEMWRNIGLSFGCVSLVTLVLLVDLRMSLYVFLCVVATLVNIIGFLHFWGMTIDVITCVNMVLAIGLCVDYAVHIAHAYICMPGARVERTVSAVMEIGPAVLNGGMTTALAALPLIFSTSHVFVTFFRVFILTVLFGVWHGLVALPVLLASFGPEGHTAHTLEAQETARPALAAEDEGASPASVSKSESSVSSQSSSLTSLSSSLSSVFSSHGSSSPGRTDKSGNRLNVQWI